MDDVAKATGRSRTSIYYYFKNRDEMFRAAVDAIVVEMAKSCAGPSPMSGTWMIRFIPFVSRS